MSVGYRKRDRLLLELGYNSYGDYLSSDIWKRIRIKFLAKNKVCYGCSSTSECVHHRMYTEGNLLGETESGLVPLCQYCHHKIEFDGKRKLSHHQANKKLDRVFRGSTVKVKRKRVKHKGDGLTNEQRKRKERAMRKLNATRKEQEKLAERNRHLF